MTDLIFVYGTLRSGFSRHRILRRVGASIVGWGSVQGELWDLGFFPGARPSDRPKTRIIGEVYRLRNPDRALAVLDTIEGFQPIAPESSLFRRQTVPVALVNGQQTAAWVYWLNRLPVSKRSIPSGDYGRWMAVGNRR